MQNLIIEGFLALVSLCLFGEGMFCWIDNDKEGRDSAVIMSFVFLVVMVLMMGLP